jgi:cysteine dioxygenase
MVSIEELVNGLRAIADSDFTTDGIYEYLSQNRVDIGTLERYLFWSERFYTRNLIYKDERFEVMALCWEKGQVSRVHDHAEQKCWMSMVQGTLKGQNFGVVEADFENGTCRLEETSHFTLSDSDATKVELEEPIHQILNLEEFDSRAISLHVYSKPFDSCLSFCRETDTVKEVTLHYTSVDGELCEGVSL